ncbi:hypothetical protein L914_03778, partial [Phytophthora nicotianae]
VLRSWRQDNSNGERSTSGKAMAGAGIAKCSLPGSEETVPD